MFFLLLILLLCVMRLFFRSYPLLQGVLNPDLLSLTDREKAELMYTNTLQILEQFKVSMQVFWVYNQWKTIV